MHSNWGAWAHRGGEGIAVTMGLFEEEAGWRMRHSPFSLPLPPTNGRWCALPLSGGPAIPDCESISLIGTTGSNKEAAAGHKIDLNALSEVHGPAGAAEISRWRSSRQRTLRERPPKGV